MTDNTTQNHERTISVRDFMTTGVTTTSPEASVIEAAQILFEHNFDGLPVVDDSNRLVGIITQYDLLSKGANIHLPTFIQLMQDLPLYKKDKSMVKPGLEKIVSMRVSDVMNPDPIVVEPHTPLQKVSNIFTQHHRVNPIPVVDAAKQLQGIISRYDIIRLYTGSMATATVMTREKSIDRKVDVFMNQFDKRFVLVSRFRTKTWIIASLLFAIVGFVIAFAIIIRIQLK